MSFICFVVPTEAASFSPRLSEPSTSSQYWIHTSYGGLNSCIIASGNSVLPNCVGYAWGRAYEILNKQPDLSRGNAGDWFAYNKNKYDNRSGGYAYSTDIAKPKLGAIVCWSQPGKAGHVAVVEQINGNQIVTSESGWGSKRFWTTTRNTNNSTLNQSGYVFQGYIYLLGSGSVTPTPGVQEPTNIIYPTSGATYKIASGVGNNMYLDCALSSNNVQIYENCDGHSDPTFVKSQYFTLTHVGNGWYYLKNVGNGKVVDVVNADPSPGTNVQQYDYNGSDAQLFRFYDAGNGYCYIKSKLGCYVDVNGGINVNNTNVQIYTFNATTAQKWKLIKKAVPETHTHSYTSTITRNPTCKTDGIRTYKCSCGDSYTQNIGKHPATHEGGTEIRNAIAATCRDTGYTGDTYCKGCGVCIGFGTSTAKNYNNHTGGTTIKNTKNPTCTAEGYTGDTYCKGCNTMLSSGKAIAKIPHAYEEIARIYPDCIKTGLITYACYCGASYDEVIPANGHTETDWIIYKSATCTAAGTKYKKCTVCEELLAIEVIPVLPHNYDSVVTKETCTTDGYTTYACPDCGHTYVGDETKATGHFDSEWIIDIAPTCTAKGYKHIECTVCGETLKTESIAKTPHDYNYVVTDATCETDGYTTVTCPDCGDTYITDEVPAFGHNDENKDTLCDACGLQLTCEHCGRPVHEGQTNEYLCIIIMTIKLLMNFLNMVTK